MNARPRSLAASKPPATAPGRIIVGRILHQRLSPRPHAFDVPAFMLWLPMSRPDPLPGYLRSTWISFDEREHAARDGTPALQWIRDLLSRHAIVAAGDIELVAFPRMLGYAFKPVSFWICRDPAGDVRAVVAEVRNTFGETHAYVLYNPDGSPLESGRTLQADKRFHVSPFLDVRGEYRFRFDFGPERFAAHIDYYDDGLAGNDGGVAVPVLRTSIAGRTRPLTHGALIATAVRFPLQSIATTARIHWHALRLWLKRVPWFSHPGIDATRAADQQARSAVTTTSAPVPR